MEFNIDFSGMGTEEIASALAALQAQAKAARAQIRAAEKAAKEEAKAAAKAAKGTGDIEKLAKILASIERENPLTKKEIFARYLECLGISEEDERSLKKEATLSAQLGARIAPKLEKLGCKLGSIREEGTIRYYCYPIEG